MKNIFNLNKKSGFSLIELIVSLGVFSVISVALIGLFVSSLKSQRKAINMQLVQDNARLAMEIMVRELRDASNLSTVSSAGSESITFIDKYSKTINYTRSCATNCMLLRSVNAAPGTNLVSDDVSITALRFAGVQSGVANQQPRATIYFTLTAGSGTDQAVASLQTTVSLRNISF